MWSAYLFACCIVTACVAAETADPGAASALAAEADEEKFNFDALLSLLNQKNYGLPDSGLLGGLEVAV